MTASTEKYVRVFIGRFQPFHNGHLKVLRAAIDTSDLTVVMIGSAGNVSSPKNPWSFFERKLMISGALTPKERQKVEILPVLDKLTDEEWVKEVRLHVRDTVRRCLGRVKTNYTLVGCHKGAETYYLKLYKGWNLDLIPQNQALNATDIRNMYFDMDTWFPRNFLAPAPSWAEVLPGSSYAVLELWHQHFRPLYLTLANLHKLHPNKP